MKTLSMDPTKQVCKSIGVVDLTTLAEDLRIGERVILDFPEEKQNYPGTLVSVDNEKKLGYIQVLDMYRLFA